ncbi:unnamed protein product [marine sediment metagenome]|uniref:Uncharacterized protein n=1 Tax=marine sediment metagenome TaxID=412755 RepID=X1C538_9ZZZZ
MSHLPAYDLFWDDPRPEINWNTPDGRWVGIGGYDWVDLIGKEVLKLTDEFEYEVWQPDLRADKIYTHVFSNGLIRKLFPAEQKKKLYGIKKIKYTVSQSIYENLVKETRRNRVILRLGAPSFEINRNIIDLGLSCPIIIQYFGEFKGSLNDLFKFKRNMLAKINDIREHFVLKKIFDKVDFVQWKAQLLSS